MQVLLQSAAIRQSIEGLGVFIGSLVLRVPPMERDVSKYNMYFNWLTIHIALNKQTLAKIHF
jgi:hypothetical protein